MNRKKKLDPFARRITAIKNIEIRQNTMLRAEPMVEAETIGLKQESPNTYRNKRTMSDSSPSHSKRARRNTISEEQGSSVITRNKRAVSVTSPAHSKNTRSNKTSEKEKESPKKTRNWQRNRNLHESPHSSKIPVNKINNNYIPQTRTSDENSSVIENSDDEPIKITSSVIMSTSLNVDTVKTADRAGDKEDDETRSLNDDITLQKEMDVDTIENADRPGDKEDDETRSLNDETSITLQKEIDVDTIKTADRPGNKEDDETRSLNNDITLQKEMDVDTIETADRPGDKENEETRSINDKPSIILEKEMDVNTTETADRPGDKENEETRSINDEPSIILEKEMDVNTTETADRPGDKENEETRSLNDKSSITLEKEITDRTRNKDRNITCSLDGDTSNNSQREINPDAIKTTDKPGDKERDETNFLDGEASTNLQKDLMNLDTTNDSDRHEDKESNENYFLDGDNNAIRHDVNFNRESFNLLCGSNLDMNISLDDLNELDGNLSNVLEDVASPSNINSSMPIENNEMPCSDDAMSSNNIEIIRQKRKAKKLFKNSCIDFISDNEDFSSGSSERWSPCESEESESDETKTKKVKKQKKKPNEQEKQKTINKNVISRLKVPRKNKRKSQRELKNSGKSYENRAGKLKEEKSMKENPCVPGNCARECYNIPDERRKCIFDHFWALDYQRQRDWIVLHSKVTDIKRKKTKLDVSRRNKTIEYFINEGEGTRQVCQQFLMKTLDVSQKLLQYTNSHAVDGMSLTDQRSFNGVLKYSEDAKKYAREFIDKLPAVSSHYCRSDSQKLYLPQELKNISNLYRLYSKECQVGSIERISEKMFRQIFTGEYNLSFHVPKKDKCIQCVKAENQTEMTITEQEQLKIHLEEKKASYNRFKVHQNLQSEDTVVTSFDLQKVLNTPYGDSMLLYYSRKYSMYNLTFYESQTQKGFCYLWGECDAKRGSNEVATCITKYLEDVDTRGKKNVLLYCDACCGQNKNKVVLTAIHHFLTRSENIQVIQINFLLPGHSYMPVDSMHAVIEREVKRLIVWSPSQWPTYIEAARKNPFPYKVETLEYSDILDWNELSAKVFQGDPIKDFRKVRVVTMKKKNLKSIEIKYSMKDDTETNTVQIFQNPPSKKGKGKGKNKTPKTNDSSSHNQEENTYENIHLQPLYKGKQTISQAKYDDLRKLCIAGTIPKRFHTEYLSLSPSLRKRDKLPETDEDENEDEN